MSATEKCITWLREWLDLLPREPWVPTQHMKVNRMDQTFRRECEPFALNSVIRLNENYLELANPNYQLRGLLAPVFVPLGAAGVTLFGWVIWAQVTASITSGQPLLTGTIFYCHCWITHDGWHAA